MRVDHFRFVLHGREAGGADDALDLGLDAALHVRIQRHEEQRPLERRVGRFRAGDEEVLDGALQVLLCSHRKGRIGQRTEELGQWRLLSKQPETWKRRRKRSF